MLPLRFPEKGAVRGQLTAAAEVVGLTGDEVHRPAAAGVEVGGIGGGVGVDGHQHTLAVASPLEDDLLVGEHYIPVSPVTQGFAPLFSLGQPGDPVGEGGALRLLNGGPEGRVAALALGAGEAPLAAIVDGGHPGHPEDHGPGQAQMVRVGEL